MVTAPLSGRRLGEFILSDQIGEGGFGVVYRADQPILEREAVIKVANVRGINDETAIQRFLGEARLASRLDHPFAAHIYAFGAEPDGLLWIAMELVRGTPLDVVLAEHGPLPVERAIPFLNRLCEVVHTAHEQGIVHRDLKPANVMVVARAGSVFPKLLDLGIAADLRITSPPSGSIEAARTLGTPLYMSPEMWLDGRKAGPPADIYALGAIVYEVLVGKPPFIGSSVMEIAAKHARKSPPPLGDGFPIGLDAVIARAMAKRVVNRYVTALELGEALRTTAALSLDLADMPRLDELTRDDHLAHAPQPIAEAVAALDAARTTPQVCDAIGQITRTCARYVALVAYACHIRAAGNPADPTIVGLLVRLRDAGLDTASWWKLARELCRPFAVIPDVHPMPELVGLFFEGHAPLRTAMELSIEHQANAPSASADPQEARKFLVVAIPTLAKMLRSLAFLQSYRLVVVTDGRAEEWKGIRRPIRAAATLAKRAAGTIEHALIVDAAGVTVAELDLVTRIGSPSSGEPPELFWLDGSPKRGGARFIAMPSRLERGDDAGWQALGLAGQASDRAAASDDVPPYRGLMTFTEADAGMFFGRELDVQGFVNRLRTMPLIAVVGPSGAGKSSFVRAGVLPALGADGSRWRSIVVRPGTAPLEALRVGLEAAGVTIDRERLRTDPDALGAALRERARSEAGNLILIVDQFEELFTLCLDPVEQEAYATALVRAAQPAVQDRSDDVRVVITLRDDFLVRAAQLAVFRERLATSLQLLTTPVTADLMRILVEPARRMGYEFEDDKLPSEMVGEVASQPAALALLSFTASQLWQYRDRQFKQLPRKAYKALGGVGGALAQHAEATLGALSESEQQIVREVFRHLVTSDGTRAVLSRSELLQVAGGKHERADGERADDAVLERLIHARLLVAMESSTGGDSGEIIEVVHEALLAAWPRLVRWRQEDAEGARLRDQVRVAARQWHERGRPRGLLWRGEALVEYRLWRARYPGALTDIEEAFGAASSADAVRSQRIRRTILGTVLVGLVVALVIFARLRSAAEDSRARAEANRARAESGEAEIAQRLTASYVEQGRRALVDGQPMAALLYFDQAAQRGADGPAFQFMVARALQPLDAEIATLRGHAGHVWDVAIAPDGRRVLSAGEDGTVRQWDVTGQHQRTYQAHLAGEAIDVAWLDPKRFVSGGGDGKLKIWNVETGEPEREFDGKLGPVFGVAVDTDRKRVLAGSQRGRVHVWSLDVAGDGKELGTTAVGATRGAFAPRGDRIAIATHDQDDERSGGASVWSSDGRRVAELAGHTRGVWYAFFDPRGERVATASLDNSARIWNADSGRARHVLRGHDARVTDVAWSLDGALVATASADSTIKVWNAERGETVHGLRGHTAQVNRLRFTRNGLLVSAAADGTARLWDPMRGTLLATYAHGGFLFQVDTDERGEILATASWAGTARLWHLRPTVRTLAGKPTTSASPPQVTVDGTRVVRHTEAGGELWTLATGALQQLPVADTVARGVSREHVVLADKHGGVHRFGFDGVLRGTWKAGAGLAAIAVAKDGSIATAHPDGTIATWGGDGAPRRQHKITGQPVDLEWAPDASRLLVAVQGERDLRGIVLDSELRSLGTLDNVYGWFFSPDSTRLITTHGERFVYVRDRDGREQAKLELGANMINATWGPRSDRIYIAGRDGSVEVWSFDTSWRLETRIAAHRLYVPSISVSEDGHLLVTVGADSMIKIWDATTFRQLYEIAVAPGTSWATLVSTGALIASDGTMLDVWPATRSTITPAVLREIVRCRIPVRLDGQAVVPADPSC